MFKEKKRKSFKRFVLIITERSINREIERPRDRETERPRDRETERESDKLTDVIYISPSPRKQKRFANGFLFLDGGFRESDITEGLQSVLEAVIVVLDNLEDMLFGQLEEFVKTKFPGWTTLGDCESYRKQ